MPNYINANFKCNEYYLLENLLAYSYKFSSKDSMYYQSTDVIEQKNIDEFLEIAKKIPGIQALINYGDDFDKQIDNNARNKLASNMSKRLEKLATISNDEEFEQIEGYEVKQAFDSLKKTDFYKAMLDRTLEHKENLKFRFENFKNRANEALEPILQNIAEKQIDTVVLPPQLFDNPYAIETQGNHVITCAAYPEEFNEEISNLDIIAMIHEIMHTYIPVDKNIKFENTVQEDVYKVINHSLVELASNGELGIKLAELEDYFKTPMHQEIIKNRKTGEILKREDYIKSGIKFPKEFEFESSTQGFKANKIITRKDELSNDKIRAIVYPYFLAFKNKDTENPIQKMADEISRDEKALKDIYGEEFYNKLKKQEYLENIMHTAKRADNIINLNDVVAKEVFGIEISRDKETRVFLPPEIGKSTINIQTEEKDKAKQQIENDEKQMRQTKYNENKLR